MRDLAILLTLLTPALADAQPAARTIDCYCTDSTGDRVELGDEICLFVDGRAFTARCEMALNVPIWRDTGAGCASSSLQSVPDAGGPVLQPGAVDAEVVAPEAQS